MFLCVKYVKKCVHPTTCSSTLLTYDTALIASQSPDIAIAKEWLEESRFTGVFLDNFVLILKIHVRSFSKYFCIVEEEEEEERESKEGTAVRLVIMIVMSDGSYSAILSSDTPQQSAKPTFVSGVCLDVGPLYRVSSAFSTWALDL